MNIKLQEEIASIIQIFSDSKSQDALSIIEKAIKKYPSEEILSNICGACYAELGNEILALMSYKKALAIKPNYAEAHNNLGNTSKELSQSDLAIEN